jgi:hypothetical protein
VSKQAVEAVIGRVLLDAEFRKLLLANPEYALSSFELTTVEKTGIKSIDGETMDALARTLEDRTAKLRQLISG